MESKIKIFSVPKSCLYNITFVGYRRVIKALGQQVFDMLLGTGPCLYNITFVGYRRVIKAWGQQVFDMLLGTGSFDHKIGLRLSKF